MDLEAIIENEGDFRAFSYKGFDCSIVRSDLGYLCGYVSVHDSYKSKIDNLDCHGGITYKDDDRIGFDCAHSFDYVPRFAHIYGDAAEILEYRTMDFCVAECKKIVNQILKDIEDEI